MKTEKVEELMLNPISESPTANSAIPKPGQKIPESDPISVIRSEERIEQSADNQKLMGLEVALARALHQLDSKPENKRQN